MPTCIAASNATVKTPDTEKGLSAVNTTHSNYSAMMNTQLDPISAKLCAWAAPEYSGDGAFTDRWYWILAQIALMAAYITLNTFVQNKQYDIAKSFASLAQSRWERFKNKYAALEKKMLNEASSTKEPTTDYSGAKSRAVAAVNAAFSAADKMFTLLAKRYALCVDPSINLNRAKALSLDDTVNFNYRDAENYRDYLSDKRWNRRSDILNLGRNNIPTSFSYAQYANNAFSGVASALQQAGNGLSGLFGYLNNRNNTIYPMQFSMASPYGTGVLAAGGSSPD